MSHVNETGITQTLETNYMPYAMSVIVSRAIPEIDGFKPSHRKLLYTMYKMKLLTGPRTKSANVVGQTMKLNPHGDQAIYATMVRLTRGHDALLHPYVDSKGNFGKTSSRDMQSAASRYTEVKLDNICQELFKNIDKDTVEFVPNYDGSIQEPRLLPTTFPNVLVNANKGIAVGMASNFCSFNLQEVCAAAAEYIINPEADLMEYIKAPDFSTGGKLLYSREQMEKIFKTGVGSFKVRGKWRYNKKDNCIEIYEIPYSTTVEQIIDKVVELVKANKLKEISDIRDETDLSGLKVTLDLKRGTDPEKVILKLFRYTSLEDSFSCNFNLLINGRPQTLGIKPILMHWTDFRIGCIKNQVVFDIKKIDARLHLLRGLEKVLLDIDKAIDIIRNTEKDEFVIANLMAAFDIVEDQADYVADIKLRNINKEYILNKTKEISNLVEEKRRLETLLNSELKMKQLIVKELKEVSKKFGAARRTEIESIDAIQTHDETQHIEDYKLKVFLTDHNYFKKVSLVSLRSSGDHKLKDDDFIAQEIEGTNKDDIIFFTNKCNAYKLKLHEIDDHKVSSLGVYLPNILEMEEGEEVLFTTVTGDYSGYVLFAFDNGKIARVPLKSYETKTKRKKLVKAYSDYAPLVRGIFFKENEDVMLLRNFGDEVRGIVVNSELIAEKTTKNTRGVQAFRMRKGSKVTEMFKLAEVTFEDVERFRISRLPMSGEGLDPIEHIQYTSMIK